MADPAATKNVSLPPKRMGRHSFRAESFALRQTAGPAVTDYVLLPLVRERAVTVFAQRFARSAGRPTPLLIKIGTI